MPDGVALDGDSNSAVACETLALEAPAFLRSFLASLLADDEGVMRTPSMVAASSPSLAPFLNALVSPMSELRLASLPIWPSLRIMTLALDTVDEIDRLSLEPLNLLLSIRNRLDGGFLPDAVVPVAPVMVDRPSVLVMMLAEDEASDAC